MTQPQRPPCVLVIDNDEGVTRAISARLENLGYRCITAATGAQGLYEFRSTSVDLVISDLNMPAGDGIALAEALRQVSDVPIIFVTGFQDEFRRQLNGLSNLSVLVKPFDSNDLVDLVEAELTLAGCCPPA